MKAFYSEVRKNPNLHGPVWISWHAWQKSRTKSTAEQKGDWDSSHFCQRTSWWSQMTFGKILWTNETKAELFETHREIRNQEEGKHIFPALHELLLMWLAQLKSTLCFIFRACKVDTVNQRWGRDSIMCLYLILLVNSLSPQVFHQSFDDAAALFSSLCYVSLCSCIHSAYHEAS